MKDKSQEEKCNSQCLKSRLHLVTSFKRVQNVKGKGNIIT